MIRNFGRSPRSAERFGLRSTGAKDFQETALDPDVTSGCTIPEWPQFR
jgi:hypothetical protein